MYKSLTYFSRAMIQYSKLAAYNSIRMCQRETELSGNHERPESQEAASENLSCNSEVKQVIGINLQGRCKRQMCLCTAVSVKQFLLFHIGLATHKGKRLHEGVDIRR